MTFFEVLAGNLESTASYNTCAVIAILALEKALNTAKSLS